MKKTTQATVVSNLQKSIDQKRDEYNSKMNMCFIFDNKHMVLLKDIWETYYLIMNDNKKYLENYL